MARGHRTGHEATLPGPSSQLAADQCAVVVTGQPAGPAHTDTAGAEHTNVPTRASSPLFEHSLQKAARRGGECVAAAEQRAL